MLKGFLSRVLRRFSNVQELEAKLAHEQKVNGNLDRYVGLAEQHRGVLLDLIAEQKATIKALREENASLRQRVEREGGGTA